jgi:hypothetical protein
MRFILLKLIPGGMNLFFQYVHPSELIKFNELGKRKPYNNNNFTQPKKQLKLLEVGKTVKNLSQTEFDKANLELIINTVSPFFLIEHPAFIKYFHLTSNKVPISRRNLMRNVSSWFNDMIQQLKTELKKIEYVCIRYCRLLKYFPQVKYYF